MANVTYTRAIIFTKHTDMMPWFDGKYPNMSDAYIQSVGFNQFKKDCARLRDVQLLLLVRYDGIHTYCKIKCPINPLPIRGEFEAPSLRNVIKFLEADGWTIKQKLPISLLK